jgi:glutaredoxin
VSKATLSISQINERTIRQGKASRSFPEIFTNNTAKGMRENVIDYYNMDTLVLVL